MKLFSRIKITTGLCLFLLTSQVAGGWNKIENPFDMLMYTGDKQKVIQWGDDTEKLAFWTMLRINDDKKRKQSLHHLLVDCNDLSYIQIFLESDFTEKDKTFDFKIKYPTEYDMMYYPIASKCEKHIESAGSMCYPEEDLQRTENEELSDILTKELGDGH